MTNYKLPGRVAGAPYLNLLALSVLFFLSNPAQATDTCRVGRVVEKLERPLAIIEKRTIIDIEKTEFREIGIDGYRQKVLFGFLNPQWEKFKTMYKEGDCIFYFRSGEDSWRESYGREGYMLVRNGDVVYVLLTAFN